MEVRAIEWVLAEYTRTRHQGKCFDEVIMSPDQLKAIIREQFPDMSEADIERDLYGESKLFGARVYLAEPID